MKLYVIGLGPGEQTQMTPKAMAVYGLYRLNQTLNGRERNSYHSHETGS